MKSTLLIFSIVLIGSLSAKSQGGGIYIKIADVPGAITSGAHAGETKISALEQETVIIPPVTGGGSTGKAELHEFVIKKPFSNNTPKLMRNAIATVHVPFAEIKFYDNADVLVSIIRLEDVSITKIKTLAPECTSCPPSFEEIGLKANFKIIWTHVASNSVTTYTISSLSTTYTGL